MLFMLGVIVGDGVAAGAGVSLQGYLADSAVSNALTLLPSTELAKLAEFQR
jgi:hypothetical protein